MACCLKAISTSDANQMIETCRFACGGHGYMTSSNFPTIYSTLTAAVTYEGENTVLLLQTARFVFLQNVRGGKKVRFHLPTNDRNV